MMIQCLLVDDEPIARQGITEYISQIPFLNLVGECKDALEAVAMMDEKQVDLLFLDIQMPHLSGLDLVKSIKNPPIVVFITAFPQYALESFDLEVMDYLLKPVSFPRFLKAVEKARSFLQQKQLSTIHPSPKDYFFIKSNGEIIKILISEVLFIEGMANYVVIHTANKKFVTYLTLSGIEAQLPEGIFVRIHKSYILAFHAILSIKGDEVITASGGLPISKKLRGGVMQLIEGRMFKR